MKIIMIVWWGPLKRSIVKQQVAVCLFFGAQNDFIDGQINPFMEKRSLQIEITLLETTL